MKRQEHYFGLTLTISVLLFYILSLLGCAPTKVKIYPKETQREKTPQGRPFAEKTYAETISKWKSYEDLVKWMEKDFFLMRKDIRDLKGHYLLQELQRRLFSLNREFT